MCLRCQGMPLREHHRHLTKIIKRAGWACQSVSSSADELGPNWMHTIGIEAFGQPELIVVGMPESNALDLLNDICRDATLGNSPWPQPGDIMFHSCGDAARVAVLEVDDDLITAGEWFNMATYRRANGNGAIGEIGHPFATEFRTVAMPVPPPRRLAKPQIG